MGEVARARAARCALRAGVAFAVLCAATAIARAGQAPGAPSLPIVLEVGGGWQGPIGNAGLSLAYDRGGRLSAGVGLGLTPWPDNSVPPIGIFGRVRLLRVGAFALGLAATLSRTHDRTARTYYRPPVGAYVPENLVWTWQPGYRATGALVAEFVGRRWSMRLEGGVGLLLNDPKCSYDNGTVFYDGDCQSATIPGPYHFSLEPGRVIPSMTASLGYRFGVAVPASDEMAFRAPNTAALLSLGATLAPVLIGFPVSSYGPTSYGLFMIGAGLALGPSVGHVYAGEYVHAAGMAVLRTIAATLGPYLLLTSTIRSSDCQGSQCDTSKPGIVLAVGLLVALPILVIYDLADAPRAAARANARNGFTELGLVPTVAVGGPSPNRGLALAGRF